MLISECKCFSEKGLLTPCEAYSVVYIQTPKLQFELNFPELEKKLIFLNNIV